MDNLIINSTKKYIPDVNFNSQNGVLEMSGECYMEHTDRFFSPIFQWLNLFVQENTGKNEVIFNIRLSYLNTSAVKRMFELFKILENYTENSNGQVKVNWFFDKNDDSMLEIYDEYIEDVKLSFNHIHVDTH